MRLCNHTAAGRSVTAAVLAACMAAGMLLWTGCSSKMDAFGWYHDYTLARDEAQKKQKNMLVFVSAFSDDEGKSTALRNVLGTKAFKQGAASYVCVNLDFSSDQLSDKMNSKDSEKLMRKLMADQLVSAGLGVSETPSLFLTTKEGYMISELDCSTLSAPEDCIGALEQTKPAQETMARMTAAAEQASGLEKAQAINELFDATTPGARYPLGSLIKLYTQLDADNQTGQCGKFVLAAAEITAKEALAAQDFQAAFDAFPAAAQSPYLNAGQKQFAYYTAANMYIQLESYDFDAIISNFQAAYDADPDSPSGEYLKNMITMAKNMKLQMTTAVEQPESQEDSR